MGSFCRLGRNALPKTQERPFNGHVQHERNRKTESKINNQCNPAARFHQFGQLYANKVNDLFVREIAAVSQRSDQAESTNFGERTGGSKAAADQQTPSHSQQRKSNTSRGE